MIEFMPETCTWEVTMQCNLRCRHCGSSCEGILPGELTTAEALQFIHELSKLKIRWLSMVGGEPFMREDWDLLCRELSNSGIRVAIISNGSLIDETIIKKLKDSRVAQVSVSIDGEERLHDGIRKEGSYQMCKDAISRLNHAGIRTVVTTTVFQQNINMLERMKEDLHEIGVENWQLQMGIPMGNLREHQEMVISPGDIDRIIDFAYDETVKGHMNLYLTDCIGYYTKKEAIIRKKAHQTEKTPVWNGCNAGITSFGVLHDGGVVGCTSLRDPSFVEDNVKKRSIFEIWNDEDIFSWRRKMRPDQLRGGCRECPYVERCLGGCSNVRFTTKGSIYEDNAYCSYHLQRKEIYAAGDKINSD